MRDRTGVAPQASRLLACRKGGCVAARDKPPSCLRQGREFRFYTWEETRGRKGMACVSARLTAGKSCPLFKLVAGEASPAPPGRGQSPLPSPLKGALPPRPPKGGRYPPYPPLTGRVRGRTGQAALLPAARAGVEARQLGENTRRCMETHIACAPGGGEELSTLQTRCYPPGGGRAPFHPL